MALLDVSDVLDDPDFNTSFQVKQRIVDVGMNGLAIGIDGYRIINGVVIPDGGQDLMQTGDGEQITGDLTIYTRFTLSQGNAEQGPDAIYWDGAFYTVINSQAYRFGSGYTRAVCKLASLNPSTLGPRDDSGALG